MSRHPDHVIGLENFEQFIYRSAAVREGRSDARSQAGDLDLTVYSLRKYLRLALKGNPSQLLLLFVPEDRCVVYTELGKHLQELAPALVSRKAGEHYLGYLESQKQRLLRERGTAKVPNREDGGRKYAMHMVRLGFQGVEMMTSGRLTLPMREPERQTCLGIRTGEVSLDEALNLAGTLATDIRDLIGESPLPETGDRDAVNAFLRDTYNEVWSR